MARRQYPSDQRRFFRMESPELADSTADLSDAQFRAFVLILALANETKAQSRGDWVYVAKNRLCSVSPNPRGSISTSARVVRELCASQAWELREEGTKWSIHVRNWSQIQGFTTATTPTPTPTPTTTNVVVPDERSSPESRASKPPKPQPTAPRAKGRPQTTSPPDRLTHDELDRLMAWLTRRDWGWFESRLQREVEDCLAWYRGQGRQQACWYSTAQGWISRTIDRLTPEQREPIAHRSRSMQAGRRIAAEIAEAERVAPKSEVRDPPDPEPELGLDEIQYHSVTIGVA